MELEDLSWIFFMRNSHEMENRDVGEITCGVESNTPNHDLARIVSCSDGIQIKREA